VAGWAAESVGNKSELTRTGAVAPLSASAAPLSASVARDCGAVFFVGDSTSAPGSAGAAMDGMTPPEKRTCLEYRAIHSARENFA